jgi:hypothetical protein
LHPTDQPVLKAEIQVIGSYVYAPMSGRYEDGQFKSYYAEAVKAAHKAGLLKIMIDVRAVTGELTPAQRLGLAELEAAQRVEAVAGARRSDYRVAIIGWPPLLDPDSPAMHRARQRGTPLAMFETIAEALTWLGVEHA